jgi:hypothetical protein
LRPTKEQKLKVQSSLPKTPSSESLTDSSGHDTASLAASGAVGEVPITKAVPVFTSTSTYQASHASVHADTRTSSANFNKIGQQRSEGPSVNGLSQNLNNVGANGDGDGGASYLAADLSELSLTLETSKTQSVLDGGFSVQCSTSCQPEQRGRLNEGRDTDDF